MHVGLFLTNQHPRGTDMVAALEEQLHLVRLARDGGWDSVFTGQHLLTAESTQLQPMPFLARIAAESGEMTIGTGILLLGAANPVAVAEDLASLDVVTGGRLVAGVGLGYREAEFAAFAVARGERVRRFEANLDIVRRLWSGEPVSTDLPWCRMDEATISVVPVQQGGPPVWIGATSDPAVRRAARLGDGWIINPSASAENIKRQASLVDGLRSGQSAPFSVTAFKEIFCAPTRSEAVEIAAPLMAEKYRDYASWGQGAAHPGEADLKDADSNIGSGRFILGDPEDCYRELAWWHQEAGVQNVLLRCHWIGTPVQHTQRSVQLLTREVLPELRALSS